MNRKEVLAIAVTALLLVAGTGYFMFGGPTPAPPGKEAPAIPLPAAVTWEPIYEFGKQG